MGDYIPKDHMWLFGMSLNIFGSVMVNFGTNLMKSAHNLFEESEAFEEDGDSSTTKKPTTMFNSKNIWVLGLTIFCLGCLINFASFAFAAQSLLAALGTVQFVSNVFFAKFVLGEVLTLRIVVATAIIVGGLLLAILFSNHASESYTSGDLIDLYTPGYFLFLIILIIILAIVHAVYVVYTHHEEAGTPLQGNGIIRPVTYSLVSALVGTQSVLQSKCFAELVKATVNGDNQFNQGFIYFVIINFVCGLSFWLYRMNMALKMFDGLIIIPLLQVFWTTCAILQGGVFFQEFLKFSHIQSFFFLLGVFIVFVGVFLLTPHPKESNQAELLPTDSDHSAMGSSSNSAGLEQSTRSSIPDAFTTSSKNSLMHGFPSHHSFSNAGLSCNNVRGRNRSDTLSSESIPATRASLMEDSTHSLFSLTFIPVVVERLEPIHQRRTRAMSTNLGDIEVGKGISKTGKVNTK